MRSIPYFLFFALLAIAGSGTAQSSAAYRSVAKVTPLTVLDPFVPGIHLTWEQRLFPEKRLFWQPEAGVLFSTGLSDSQVARDVRGFRIRNELRYYLFELSPGESTSFIGFQLGFQWSTRQMTADFARAAASYFQTIDYRRDQELYTFYLGIGANRWWKNSPIITEIALAAGPRLEINRAPDLPSDAEFFDNGTLFGTRNPNQDRWTPGFAVQFRIGYVLR